MPSAKKLRTVDREASYAIVASPGGIFRLHRAGSYGCWMGRKRDFRDATKFDMAGDKDFHDGGGLCLPGRWRKEVRELADGANWYWLRREMKKTILEFVGSEKELELEAFRMASGGEANWRVARDEGRQNKLLQILCRWLETQDMGEKAWMGSSKVSPFG